MTDEGKGVSCCLLTSPEPEEKESSPGENSLTEEPSQVPAVSFQPLPPVLQGAGWAAARDLTR